MSLKFMSGVLYRLKQQYGMTTTFVRVVQTKPDPKVGTAVAHRQEYSFPIIRLPDKSQRSIMYSVLFQNLKSGGSDFIGARGFLIDSKDLPTDYRPDESDLIIVGDLEYKIVKVTELDYRIGYHVMAKTFHE